MTVAMLMRQERKAGFDEGWKDGEANGLKLGEENASRRIALSMLDLGIPEGTVLAATGVTKEQLAKLKDGI